jgi:hypothetical protein
MILTTHDVQRALAAWRERGELIDRDIAQTIAGWWYSPGAPAMVEFVTAGRITDTDALYNEIQLERDAVRDLPEHEELDALLGWLDAR